MISSLKKSLGTNTRAMTQVLHTPLGSFYGDNVLEGFAADAEQLGQVDETENYFDKEYYRTCKLENAFIFEINENKDLEIPPMKLADLNRILFSKMKLGKACDIYQLTVEHLRYCGDQARLLILNFINKVIDQIFYLSCQQIKLGIATAIHKG